MSDNWRIALDKANEVRLERARLKREIRSGDVRPQDVLREPFPSWMERMPVGDLLCAVKGIQKGFVERALFATRLGRSCQMQFVTIRQRNQLIEALNQREQKNASKRKVLA